MKINLHTPLEEIQVPIIPMIDVIFCILTFFLLAALQYTRQQAIHVDLPKANTGDPSGVTSQDILPVTIDAVGQIYIEKNLVKRENLEPELQKYIQTHPNGILLMNASRTTAYNDVIQTIDVMRKVGGKRVALGIIPGSSQPAENLQNPPTSNYSIPPNNISPPGNNPPGYVDPQQVPPAPNQLPPGTGYGINSGVSPMNPDGSLPQVPPPENGNLSPQVPVPVPPGNSQGNFNPSLGSSAVVPRATNTHPKK